MSSSLVLPKILAALSDNENKGETVENIYGWMALEFPDASLTYIQRATNEALEAGQGMGVITLANSMVALTDLADFSLAERDDVVNKDKTPRLEENPKSTSTKAEDIDKYQVVPPRHKGVSVKRLAPVDGSVIGKERQAGRRPRSRSTRRSSGSRPTRRSRSRSSRSRSSRSHSSRSRSSRTRACRSRSSRRRR